jgi:hypothetical protein
VTVPVNSIILYDGAVIVVLTDEECLIPAALGRSRELIQWRSIRVTQARNRNWEPVPALSSTPVACIHFGERTRRYHPRRRRAPPDSQTHQRLPGARREYETQEFAQGLVRQVT